MATRVMDRWTNPSLLRQLPWMNFQSPAGHIHVCASFIFTQI